MPPIPDVRLTFKDGALGLLPAETDKIQLVLGVSSSGPVNEMQAVTTKDRLRSTFGFGPLVEASGLKLDIGGGPIYAMRVAAATPGAMSAVSMPAQGAPAIAVAGTPFDHVDARIR